MQKISGRLKLWLSSHMLMYPHLQVQEASTSSDSVESMRSALVEPLLTQHESITCQSSADHLDLSESLLSLPLSEPSIPRCHVQNDGYDYRDEEIPDEYFWASLVSSWARIPFLLNQNIRQKMTVQYFNVCQMLLNSLNSLTFFQLFCYSTFLAERYPIPTLNHVAAK